MEFIIENATALLWTLGGLQVVGILLIWPCLAISKQCEERNE